MAQFFIRRPIFAWVLAIVIMLAGGLSIFTLPLEQYPDIAPPRVSISATYTGASAETVENSVTQVIEQQLKGIDNLIYMGSSSDASGRTRTTLTSSPGTNIDVAQVQVQNKLQAAMSRLPDAVQSRGVFVTKGGNDYLTTYSFTSPDPNVSQVDIGDYLSSNLVDVIGRIDGVGDVSVFGTGYAMRIWMNPALLEAAADLYATPRQAFWRNSLPLLMPGILSGAMMAFIISMDDFVITYFVAGAGSTTLPIYIFSSIRMGISPKINAISSIMLVISILFVALSYYLGQRKR